MLIPGNTWQTVWDSAKPVSARRQVLVHDLSTLQLFTDRRFSHFSRCLETALRRHVRSREDFAFHRVEELRASRAAGVGASSALLDSAVEDRERELRRSHSELRGGLRENELDVLPPVAGELDDEQLECEGEFEEQVAGVARRRHEPGVFGGQMPEHHPEAVWRCWSPGRCGKWLEAVGKIGRTINAFANSRRKAF